MTKWNMARLTFSVSLWALVLGVQSGLREIERKEAERDRPYILIMQDAVDQLKQIYPSVHFPQHLPALLACSACLKKGAVFGAYMHEGQDIIVPDYFDPKTPDGRAILIHEYGHYLLTEAGVPASSQEKLCLALGNISYRKFFMAALSAQ